MRSFLTFLSAALILSGTAASATLAHPQKGPKPAPKKAKVSKPAPKTSVTPAKNGMIAFSSDHSGQLQLDGIAGSGKRFSITSSDSSVNQLDTEVAFSPDGAQIAFVRTSGNDQENSGVWVATNTGAHARELLDGAEMPSFAPDGATLVVSVANDDGIRHLALLNVKSGKATTLCGSDSDMSNPAVSPDGTQIVYTDSDAGLVLAQLKPKLICKAKVLDPGGDNASFSATGALSWSNTGADVSRIMVAAKPGASAHSVSPGSVDAFDPAFAPDGTQVAFQARSDNGDFEIFVVKLAGGGVRNLTNDQIEVLTCDPEDAGCDAASPPDDVMPAWQPLRG